MNDQKNSSIELTVHDEFQTLLVVDSFIEHVKRRTFACIYSKELDRKSGEFTKSNTMETLKDLVKSCYLNIDQGESPTNPWQPSEEPVRCKCKSSQYKRQMGMYKSQQLFVWRVTL